MKTFWSSDCPLIRYCCAENPKSRMGARLAQLLKSAASQPIKPKNYCKFVASPWWNDMKRKQEPSSCIFLLSTNSQNQRWSKKCLACFAVRETLGKGLRVVSVWVALPHNAACQKISFAKHTDGRCEGGVAGLCNIFGRFGYFYIFFSSTHFFLLFFCVCATFYIHAPNRCLYLQ